MNGTVKVCGLCKTPLTEEVLKQGGVEISRRWHHDTIKDHEPLAMDPEQAEGWAAKCDFCFDDIEADLYSLVSKPFVLVIGPGQSHHMSALWAICKPCRLAQQRGWDHLTRRMIKKALSRDGRDAADKYQTERLFKEEIELVKAGFVEVRPTTIQDLIDDGRL